MPFNSLISRTDAAALIPEDVSREIVQGVTENSLITRLSRRLPNMPRNQRRMPVLSALPTAYFVTGSNGGAPGLKQTAEIAWGNKYLNAEEIACIVPLPEEVIDDADYDIWGEVRPRIVEAMGVVFDAAVIHGTNAPSDWPDDIVTSATAAGNTVTLGAGVDLYEDLMETDGLLAAVESDGNMVTGHIAGMSMRARLRGVRDADGQPLFRRGMTDATRYELDGEPIEFSRNGALDETAALQIAGDFQQLVYSMRQDITFKILTEAVIQDGSGNIVYNLAQQDMVALRAVMRIAWQVPNPINRLQQTEANRYPFAVLLP